MLHGRVDELARIGQLLADARRAQGGALVLRGDAGIGKTILLDRASEMAGGMRVLRGIGIEFEAELPFAGLHMLLHPFLDRLDALPGRQADVLRGAFGIAETVVRDRFLIGVATLTLLSDIADDRPLLCLLDDAQWLDDASSAALLFAARRLTAEPIAMIFAVRGDEAVLPAPGVEAVRVRGLDPSTAAALLAEYAPGLADPVRARVLREADGNPLALIELAAALAAEQHSGRVLHEFHVGPLPAVGRVQDAFRRQIADLPAATQLALVVAAADDTTSVNVIMDAGKALGLSAADLDPAVRSGLVIVTGDGMSFRHPLVRAAAYRAATSVDRVSAHRALAEVLLDGSNADRRAWHLAAATSEPDEEVAGELERAAQRAGSRGGSTAMATAYERSAELSIHPARRSTRLAKAARAAYDAGRTAWATDLASRAAASTDDASVIAEATYIQAQIDVERVSPAAGGKVALNGARRIVSCSPEQAAIMLTEAVWIAWVGGDSVLATTGRGPLEAVTLPPTSPLRPAVAGMLGFLDLLDGAPAAAMEPMRGLVAAVQAGSVDSLTVHTITGFISLLVGDDDAAAAMLETLVVTLRAGGMVGWLPYALEPLALAQCLRGRFLDAAAAATEGTALAVEVGQRNQVTAMTAISAWLDAVSGDEERCRSLAAEVNAQAARHVAATACARWALGLLELAAGRADAALEHLDSIYRDRIGYGYEIRAAPDFVEAAVRSGHIDRARTMSSVFQEWARHSGHLSTGALALRCQALLDQGSDADTGYAAALRAHETASRPYDMARTHLVYGEWLRRQRRRSDAGAQLSAAMELFDRLGARRWAERAAAELEVLGARPAPRSSDTGGSARLTPQELQVVRLAAAGLSNKEIGAQLFLSPRTVGHHLYRVFPKLGVTRRMELAYLDLGSVT